ncbi:hypothetical protein ACVMB3_007280 [Sinorhizobium meliloti]
MLVAGHETTVTQIEFGLLAMFRHPQQRERLVGDPSLVNKAVEEMLRMYPPGAGWDGIMRYPKTDVTIAGMHIPAESKVLVGLPATSFDPRHFDDPEIFDIGREEKPHLAFSHGPHYCIGVEPARLELKLVFGSIFLPIPMKPPLLFRDDCAPGFRDDLAPCFRDDLAPCLVGSAGDDCCQFIQARCQALRGRFRRRLSPLNSMRWALWTNLSSMASA